MSVESSCFENVFVLFEDVHDQQIGVLDQIAGPRIVAGVPSAVLEHISGSPVGEIFLEEAQHTLGLSLPLSRRR